MDSNRLLLLTYNLGKEKLSEDYVGDEVIKPILSGDGSGGGPPKFVVISLQEVCPIMNGCFGDLSEYLEPILKGIENALDGYGGRLNRRGNYSRIGLNSYGAIALIVYVFVPEGSNNSIKKVLLASTGCGYLRSSLKGGVGIRVVLDSEDGGDGDENELFTFVAAHLTANEGMVYYRNRDYLDIVTMLDFGDGFGAYHPKSHLFFLGDLNYRCTEDPFGGEVSITASTSASTTTPISASTVTQPEEEISLLSDENSSIDISRYIEIDELSIAKRQGDAFLGFSEAPITFPPSFKFFENTQKYNRKRIPSWCDRILYLSYEGVDFKETVERYSSLQGCNKSDHRPVYLSIVVPNTTPKLLSQHRDLVLPRSSTDTRPISLALTTSRSRNNSLVGYYADRSIGWSLYLSTTHQGHIYSVIGGSILMTLYIIYLFFF